MASFLEGQAPVVASTRLARPAVSTIIIAARTIEHPEDNIRSGGLALGEEDTRMLDVPSGPGIPVPNGWYFNSTLQKTRTPNGPTRNATQRATG